MTPHLTQQVRYLIKRRGHLWNQILAHDNVHCHALDDQVRLWGYLEIQCTWPSVTMNSRLVRHPCCRHSARSNSYDLD